MPATRDVLGVLAPSSPCERHAVTSKDVPRASLLDSGFRRSRSYPVTPLVAYRESPITVSLAQTRPSSIRPFLPDHYRRLPSQHPKLTKAYRNVPRVPSHGNVLPKRIVCSRKDVNGMRPALPTTAIW